MAYTKKDEKKTQISRTFIILWGFIMHIILLWGVLDANFHSPIISGLPTIPMPNDFPAKRVLIFIADGLRFRTFRDHIPPYLNSVIEKKGVWGISHTRMPTESRPGNIAIVAGLYEDPSALFKGWKENPVHFDSVFNQSKASWLWGSPDIIPLFTKGERNNVYGETYPPSWQDFSIGINEIKRLDEWVFKQYWNWLETKAFNYKTENKIIFYFHLLGCDTIGHAAKPQSKGYKDIMFAVDHNLKKVVEKTEKFFEDNRTAYIFTSDHGMTDWGSHGSGSIDETETPFVVWGAGVKKGAAIHSIEQADITPLISTLLGISIPVNNEGILPYDVLDLTHKNYISQALLVNAKQLAEQVKANRELTVGQSLINMYSKDKELNERLASVQFIQVEKNPWKIFEEAKGLTTLAKDTLNYYRRYQRNRFLFCLMLMWIAWIILLFSDLSGEPRKSIRLAFFSWMIVPNIALTVIIIPLVIEYSVAGCKEWRLLGYGIISALSGWLAFRSIITKGPALEINSNEPLIEMLGIIILTLMMFIGLLYRWTFSIAMILAVNLQKILFDTNASSRLVKTGIALALFPLLPVVGPEPRMYIVLIAVGVSIAVIVKHERIYYYNKVIEILRLILTSLLCLNAFDGRWLFSWLLLISTPFVIWLYPKNQRQRFFGISVSLLSPLSLLSASYEPLFFLLFAMHLQEWPVNEHIFKQSTKLQILNLRNFSTAAFLMLYTLISFFGTGNMASLSSFDPTWTRHFLTVFSPFTMAALILLKIIMPLILVGCLIRSLATDSIVFSSVLLLGDFLAIPLMYNVTPHGSWLDIGSAISRFVIAIVLPCFLVIVYYATGPLITFSLQEFVKGKLYKNTKFKI